MSPAKGSGSLHTRKVLENLGRTTLRVGELGTARDGKGRGREGRDDAVRQ